MDQQIIRVAVTAATYNRPAGLAALLDGIALQNLPPDVALRVVIVDNSTDGNAREYVEQTSANYRFPLTYRHEEGRGISYARNRALKEVLAGGDDYMASIDDDEVPDPDWISKLLEVLIETRSTAVVGTILPAFEAPPPWWIEKSGFFDSSGFEDRQPVPHGYTSNALLDMSFIRRLGLTFDLEYSLSGGEDTDFFLRLKRGGGKVVFAQHSVVHETIVPSRATFRWLTQFWFRSGNTDGFITYKALGKSGRARIELFLRGTSRTLVGIAGTLGTAPLILFGNTTSVRFWRILCRGLGYLVSSVGVVYQEYKDHNR